MFGQSLPQCIRRNQFNSLDHPLLDIPSLQTACHCTSPTPLINSLSSGVLNYSPISLLKLPISQLFSKLPHLHWKKLCTSRLPLYWYLVMWQQRSRRLVTLCISLITFTQPKVTQPSHRPYTFQITARPDIQSGTKTLLFIFFSSLSQFKSHISSCSSLFVSSVFVSVLFFCHVYIFFPTVNIQKWPLLSVNAMDRVSWGWSGHMWAG